VLDITEDAPTLDDVIRFYVLCVCEGCEWNLVHVSRVLGVSYKAVYNWMHKYEKQGFLERVAVKPGSKKTVWKLKAQRDAV
jgi:transposase